MDEKKKTADAAVVSAQSALDAAKAALVTAEEGGDAAVIATAQGKVTEAATALADAQAARIALDEDGSGSDDGVDDDVLKDALGDSGKLKDGTPADKDITISRAKFQDLNEQAKLLDQFAPVLAKLQKDPALVEKLMKGDDPSQSLSDRLKALEDRERNAKRTEVTTVIKSATTAWPDFSKHWDGIKPILAGLEASGIPYAEAVQRAYFAVNPDALKEGKRIVELQQARNVANRNGEMGPHGGGNGGPIINQQNTDEFLLSDADKTFAQAAGIDPKLYSKHKKHIDKFADL